MKQLLLIIFSIVLLVGCSNTPAMEENTNDLEKQLIDAPEATPQENFLGSWQRIEMYVGGAPHDHEPAVVTYNEDGTYTSVGSCMNSGTYEPTETTNTMVMTQNGCPGDIPLPFTITYTYKMTVDDDDNIVLTTNTSMGDVTEVYHKQ